MQKFLVIGHPLAFCLSTPVLNGASKEISLDAQVETVDLEPSLLPETIERLRTGGLAGLIATMPFKTPSIAFLDDFSQEVKEINSANLILNKAGKLYGYNTDWIGAVEAMHTITPSLKGKKILILGAGGAARAVAYGFKKEGAEIFAWNRTPEKANAYAEKMDITFVEDLNEFANACARKPEDRPDIIVNATASSSSDRQKTIVPFALWEKVEIALDAVYGKTSLFLEEAKASKVPHVLSCEIWFLKQVLSIFELITGKPAPVELMTRLTAESKEIAR